MEVHQDSELDIVDIFILDILEVEAMVAVMNKQLSVYLSNYIFDAGIGKVFVNSLIQREIFLSLNHADGTCTWDINNKTVTTHEDTERERQQLLEEVEWYKDEYGAHMSTKGLQMKKEYVSPDMLYFIDGDHSIKTIHEHHGKGYASTPGAATIDL